MFKALDSMATFQLGPSGMEQLLSMRTTDRFEYARVFPAKFSLLDGIMVKTDDEPIGVIAVDCDTEFWIRLDGRWVPDGPDLASDGTEGFVYDVITKAEYESDLAFGLWPKLKTTSRPIRKWLRSSKQRLFKWNGVAALLGFAAGMFLINDQGDMNTRFIVGLCLVLHACLTGAWVVVNGITGHDRLSKLGL